jgi:phage-related protein
MGVALAGVAFLIIRNWEQVKSKFRDVVSGISNSVTNISNSIKDGFRKAIDYVNNLISKWNPLNKVSGLVSGIANALKGKIPGFANGVRNFSGGLAVVGERGPELVNLPKGSDVFTNEESRRMTAGNGGITIENMNIRSGIDWELGAQYMAQKLRLS